MTLNKRQPGYHSRALVESSRTIPWLASGGIWCSSSRKRRLGPRIPKIFLIGLLGISFLTWKNSPNNNKGITRKHLSSAFERYLGWHLGSSSVVEGKKGVWAKEFQTYFWSDFWEFRSSLEKNPQTATRVSLESACQELSKDTLVGFWGFLV
jgi:hypothetical protein